MPLQAAAFRSGRYGWPPEPLARARFSTGIGRADGSFDRIDRIRIFRGTARKAVRAESGMVEPRTAMVFVGFRGHIAAVSTDLRLAIGWLTI